MKFKYYYKRLGSISLHVVGGLGPRRHWAIFDPLQLYQLYVILSSLLPFRYSLLINQVHFADITVCLPRFEYAIVSPLPYHLLSITSYPSLIELFRR